MALSEIKHANKKAKHEARRKLARQKARREKAGIKIRNQRMRTMAIQGRREHMQQRARELDYVKQLESEVAGEQ